ncbi:MAG: tetratricopeptide repeat protein [Planctomycetes bacterium]|nr:tetratricopeptide repeat protein [Planctomycetota bacterium]
MTRLSFLVRFGLLGVILCGGFACGSARAFESPNYQDEALARLAEAEASERQGDVERALAMYRLAIDIEPTLAQAYLGRARLCDKTGRLGEAEKYYASAVYVAAPDLKPLCHYQRGLFHQRLRRHDPAASDFTAAIEASRKGSGDLMVEAHLHRAYSRIELLRWEDASQDIEFVLESSGDAGMRRRAKELKREIERRRRALRK